MKTSLNSPFLYLLTPGCWAEPHRPASLAVAQPGDSDRDINGLIDGGISPKVSWSNTSPCAADSEQEMAAVFTT